ncbi:MAG: FHA domain-containing protein [Planctomycetes bacterium]|nr:FHA domain-containing protein [Planctomycetota bacterium]
MNEYVFLMRGPRGVARLKVQGTFLVLGRVSAIPLLREDRTISREHAVLVASPRGIRLKDLGSSNGVELDGKRLGAYAEVDLSPGSRVSFGNTELVLLTQREASKRLDQPVDEVVVDPEGGTSVIRAQRRAEAAAEAPTPEPELPANSGDGLETQEDELEGDETRDALEDEGAPAGAEPTAPDAWIEDALLPAEDPPTLERPGKVTELDAEVTELELPADLGEPAPHELEPKLDPPTAAEVALDAEETVSRDAETRLAIENVVERGGEVTLDPEDAEDAANWREVEQELADLERREPRLE